MILLLGVLVPRMLLSGSLMLVLLADSPGGFFGRLGLGLLRGRLLGLGLVLLVLFVLLLAELFLAFGLLLLLAQLEYLEGVLVLVEGEQELVGDGYTVGILHGAVVVAANLFLSSLRLVLGGSCNFFLATLEPLCNRDIQ